MLICRTLIDLCISSLCPATSLFNPGHCWFFYPFSQHTQTILIAANKESFTLFTLTLRFEFPLFVLLHQQGFSVKCFKEAMSYPFLILHICLLVQSTERWRGKSSICWLNLQMTAMAQGWATLETVTFLQNPHAWARGPNIWTIFCCFSQASNDQLDRQWSSWDSKQWSYRILVSQAIALPTVPQYWATFSFLSSFFFF